MDRPIPPCPETPTQALPPGVISKEYQVEVITPLFGGGPRPGTNDPVTPIRATEIRGHLRFWWRATIGVREAGSIADLRRNEGDIWGTTKGQDDKPQESKVAVAVTDAQWSDPSPCAWYAPEERDGKVRHKLTWLPPFDGDGNSLPYALFPFQGKPPSSRGAIGPASCIQSAEFSLVLTCPRQLEGQVEAALWAWMNFGGLGARTRRGCGALYCSAFAPVDSGTKAIRDWWVERAGAFPGEVQIGEVPSLVSSLLVGTAPEPPDLAWREAVGAMRAFRQEGTGRQPRPDPRSRMSGTNKPGRSYWPEPDSIARLVEQPGWDWDPGHDARPGVPGDELPAFPRAELGLPIIFHFLENRKDEVPDPELVPEGYSRMASPIILRPLACGDGSEVLPMVVCLRAPTARSLKLRLGDKDCATFDRSAICRESLSTYPNSPLGRPPGVAVSRSKAGSAVEAFLAFARERNFELVAP